MGLRIAQFEVGKILDSSKKQIGISLGYDFCAEHEWGISGITEAFGMSKEHTGINKLKIHQFPKQDTSFQLEYSPTPVNNGKALLLFQPSIFTTIRKKYPSIASFSKIYNNIAKETPDTSDNFTTSWCNDSFCIYTDNLANCLYLDKLHRAFEKLDVLIGFSQAKNIFRRNCLQFLILSDMSDQDKDELNSL